MQNPGRSALHAAIPFPAARREPIGEFLHLIAPFLRLLNCSTFLPRARLIRWPKGRGPSFLKFPDPAGDVLPGLLRQRPFTLEFLQLLAHKRCLLQSALEGMLDVILLHHPFKLSRAALVARLELSQPAELHGLFVRSVALENLPRPVRPSAGRRIRYWGATEQNSLKDSGDLDRRNPALVSVHGSFARYGGAPAASNQG